MNLRLIVALSLVAVAAQAERSESWGLEKVSKKETVIAPESDIERTRVTIRQRTKIVDSKPILRRENLDYQKALNETRAEKTQELIRQLEDLVRRPGQQGRVGELQMRLAELYFDRSRETALQESESWTAATTRWETLSPEQRAKTRRPQLQTPRADRYRKQALSLYQGLERKSHGGDNGRSQSIQRDEVLFYLGFTWVDLGEGNKALPYLQELVQKYPSSPRVFSARLQVADLLFDRGRYADAIPQYLQLAAGQDKQGLTEQLKAYTFYKLAWSYFNTGAYDKSVLAFKRTVDLSKDGERSVAFRNEAYNDLSRTFALAGQYAEGEKYFAGLGGDGEKYLREHLRNTAELSLSRGNEKLAYQTYTKLIEQEPKDIANLGFTLEKIKILKRQRNAKQAADAYRALAKDFGPSSSWFRSLSDEDKKVYEEEIVSMYRREAKAIHKEAQRLRQESLFAQARPYYEIYFSLVPDQFKDNAKNISEMAYYYAELLFHLKDFAGAASAYAKVEQGPFAATAAYARIVALTEASKQKKASSAELGRATDEFLAKFPKDERSSELLYSAAFEAFNSGDTDTAKKTLYRILDQYPGTEVADRSVERLLFILEKEGDYVKASEEARTLLARKAVAKGSMAARLKDFEQRAVFKDVESMPEKSVEDQEAKSQAFLGLSAKVQGDLREKALNNAMVFAEKSKNENLKNTAQSQLLKEFPRSQYAQGLYFSQGLMLAREGQWKKALASYNSFLAGKGNKADDIEETRWNRLYVLLHLEDQWLSQLNPPRAPSSDLLGDSKAFLKDYPRSKFRAELLRVLAYRQGVSDGEIAGYQRLAGLKREERDMLEEALEVRRFRSGQASVLQSLVRRYPPSKIAKENRLLGLALAEASFQITEASYQNFVRNKLNFKPAAFASSFKKKVKDLENLEKAYLTVVSYGSGEVGLKSLERLAGLNRSFAQELMKAPVPASELSAFTDPLVSKNIDFLRSCLDKAVEFQIPGKGLDICRDSLRAQIPDEVLLSYEVLPAPRYLVPLPASQNNALFEVTRTAYQKGNLGEAQLGLTLLEEGLQAGRIPAEQAPYVKLLSGLYLSKRGDLRGAIKNFREVSEADGSNMQSLRKAALLDLAALYLSYGAFADSFEAADAFTSSESEAGLIAGISLMGLKKPKDAVKVYNDAYNRFKDRREFLVYGAMALKASGQAAAGISQLKKYIELETPVASHFSRRLLKEWRTGP